MIIRLLYLLMFSSILFTQENNSDARANPDSIASALYAEGNYWKLMEISKQFNADTLSAKYLFSLGMSYAALSEPQRAMELLKRSIAFDSTKLQYHFQYARVLSQSGLYDDAIDQLEGCIAMDSNYIPARFQLGLTYAAQKDEPDKELEIFSSLINRNPNDFLSHYYLADALKRIGKPDSAAIYFQFSLRANPRYLPALIAYSNYLTSKKRYMDALPVYLRADSVRSGNKDLNFQIGECYRKLNDLGKAKIFFKRAIALDSMNGLYHAQLAYTFFSKEEYDSSLAEYQQAILYDEENAQYYLNLALVYKKLNMTDLVVQSYNSAIRVRHPELIAYVYNDLAAFYFGKNMWREAIEAYQRTIDIKPDHVEALYNMGMCYSQLLENKNAIQMYTKYLRLIEHDSSKKGAVFSVQKTIEYMKSKKSNK